MNPKSHFGTQNPGSEAPPKPSRKVTSGGHFGALSANIRNIRKHEGNSIPCKPYSSVQLFNKMRPSEATKKSYILPKEKLYTPRCSLIFIDFMLVFKAFERFDTFRPSNSLGHSQNSKKVYYKLRTDFASDHFSSRTGGLKRSYASPLTPKCAGAERARSGHAPTTP